MTTTPRDQEALLSEVFHRVTPALVVLDDQLVVHHANDRALDLVPEDSSDLIQSSFLTTPWVNRLRPKSMVEPVDGLESLLSDVQSGEPLSHTVGYRDPDGNRRSLKVYVQSLEGPFGKLMIEAFDITDRRREEDRLLTLERALRSLSETTDRRSVAEALVGTVSECLDLPLAGVYLRDPEREALEPVAFSDPARELVDEEETLPDELRTFAVVEEDRPSYFRQVQPETNGSGPGRTVGCELQVPLDDHGLLVAGCLEKETVEPGALRAARILQSAATETLDRIAGERQLERQKPDLPQGERRFRQFADAVDAVFWLQEGDRTLHLSHRFKDYFGIPRIEQYSSADAYLDRIHPQDRDRVRRFRKKKRGHVHEIEYRIEGDDDRILVERGFPIRSDQRFRKAIVIEDVTRHRQMEQQLESGAVFDLLTGLPNRALFMEYVEDALRHDAEDDRPFTLFFLDIDKFKWINDTYGHDTGDRLLREFSNRLRDLAPDRARIGRLGGDEFSVLIPDLQDREEVESFAGTLLDDLSQPYGLQKTRLAVQVSVGITLNHQNFDSARDLLNDADTAMYEVKHGGGKGYKIVDRHLLERRRRQARLSHDLIQALEEDEFFVEFRPLQDLETLDLRGVEALIRWDHPEEGTLMAGEFVPAARRAGLLARVDRWILRRVVSWFHTLTHSSDGPVPGADFSLSVNVSRQFLHQPDLTGWFRELDVSEDILSRLHLEVPVDLMVNAPDTVLDVFRDLQDLGPSIVADDFGEGTVSFQDLRTLPFDALKLDQSMVQEFQGDSPGAPIRGLVEAVLTFAARLDRPVIAENVTSERERRWLVDLGCELGQGEALSEPLSLTELIKQF